MSDSESRLYLPKFLMAKAFGISVQAFSQWDVSPEKRDGREQLYWLPDVIDYRLSRMRRDMSGDGDGDELNPAHEKARLDKLRADKVELELSLLRREVFKASDIESAWGDMIGACRSKILSLPSKLATVLSRQMPPQEVEAILRSHVHEALQELADYDPKHYTPGPRPESDEENSSAAESHDQ